MKNIIKFLSLVLIFAFAVSINTTDAQTRKKKDRVDEYFDDEGTLLQQTWFGADLNFNFIPFAVGNYISYGISPIAGYKITDAISVGPRVEFSVINGRINSDFRIPDLPFRFNSVTVGAGAFARAKVGRSYFLHAEFARISQGQPSVDGNLIPQYDSNGNFVINRFADNHFFVGGGFYGQIGNVWGYQITALFDTLVSRDLWEISLPITTRFGINYKF